MKQVLTEKQLIDCQIEKRQLLKLRFVPQCYYYIFNAIANIVWFINVAYISSITLIVMQYNICKLKQNDCLLNSTETECTCFGIKYILLLKNIVSFYNSFSVPESYFQYSISFPFHFTHSHVIQSLKFL